MKISENLCPPCVGNCQQGRECPARPAGASPLSDRDAGKGAVAKCASEGSNARTRISTGYGQGWRDSALLICVFVICGTVVGLVRAVLEATP